MAVLYTNVLIARRNRTIPEGNVSSDNQQLKRSNELPGGYAEVRSDRSQSVFVEGVTCIVGNTWANRQASQVASYAIECSEGCP
jgi:hypothetical protein